MHDNSCDTNKHVLVIFYHPRNLYLRLKNFLKWHNLQKAVLLPTFQFSNLVCSLSMPAGRSQGRASSCGHCRYLISHLLTDLIASKSCYLRTQSVSHQFLTHNPSWTFLSQTICSYNLLTLTFQEVSFSPYFLFSRCCFWRNPYLNKHLGRITG